MPVQKQTAAGQRTRFKAFVAIGDSNGHLGLGVKCSREVATAIRGAIGMAKLSLIPVRRGYWGSKLGAPHTVPVKVTGRSGSVLVRLVPAPRGTGLVAAGVPKKLLNMAGIEDCYTSASGKTSTLGNFGGFLFYNFFLTFSQGHRGCHSQHLLVPHSRPLGGDQVCEGALPGVHRLSVATPQAPCRASRVNSPLNYTYDGIYNNRSNLNNYQHKQPGKSKSRMT